MYGSAPAPEDDDKPFAEGAAPYVAEFVGTYLLVFCHCSEQHLSRALGPNSDWSSACGAGLHLWSDLRSISESFCFSRRRTGGSNSMEDSHGVHRVANYSRIYCRPGMLWSFSDAHGGSPCCTLSVLGGSISGTAIHYNASVCDSQRDCF